MARRWRLRLRRKRPILLREINHDRQRITFAVAEPALKFSTKLPLNHGGDGFSLKSEFTIHDVRLHREGERVLVPK